MGVTIVDIARQLGLSDSTVSRVLNRRADRFISDATRKKVLDAAARMGYRPNRLACALVTGRSRTIAFWVSPARTHYYTEVMYHLQDRLRADGYDLVIDDAKAHSPQDASLEPALRWPYDGIVACDPPFRPRTGMTGSAYLNIPVVSVGVFFWPTVDHVGVDLQRGAERAVRHLLKRGPRVLFVAPPMDADQEPRYRAYTAVMAAAGRTPEVLHVPDLQRPPARRLIHDYLKTHTCPDGIFCFNDNLAIGVHRGLKDLGLRMPRDVAIVGCDGIEDTAYHDPPISTIDMNLDAMCETAWKFLRRRFKNPTIPVQRAMVAPRLVIRESSDPTLERNAS